MNVKFTWNTEGNDRGKEIKIRVRRWNANQLNDDSTVRYELSMPRNI